MADHVIGFVTGGVSKAIAIGSELASGEKGRASREARRQRTAAEHNQDQQRKGSADSDDGPEQNLTEYEWALEELEEELGDPPAYTEQQDQETLAFKNEVALQRLPQQVIIPQRRPGSKQRGFMRAYAPILGTHAGIDQESFLTFLNDFDKAAQSSPVVRFAYLHD